MKQVIWIAVLSGISIAPLSAQVRWDGEGIDNLWTTPANWSENIVPSSGDDVLLDNTFIVGGYTVSLAPGNISVTVNSLRISPAASFNITLLVPTTNLSSTAFMATGPGDAVVLDNGAVLINSSRATSGTPVSVGTSNFFRINNGGKYIHNTDNGHTNNLVARLSTAPGTEDGIFQFDVPGNGAYTISASNRTYGHLIFSVAAAGVNKVYTAAGISPFTIKGDLEILPGVSLSYGATTNNLIVNKNCIISAGAVFNISNSVNNSTIMIKGNLDNKGTITETGSSSGSRIEWNGTTNQQVSSTGVLSQTITMTMNNAFGLTLLKPLTLPYNLQLLSGNIKTTATNLLTISDNGICSGGSGASLVEGPMRKIGDDDFDFPVGVGTIYAPIGITGGAGASVTDAFVAEYIRTNPQSVHGNASDPFFNHLSFVEYWRLTREAGTASKQVRLTVQEYSFARIFNTIYGSNYNGAIWNNLGRNEAMAGPIFPPNETGTFKTNETAVFGDFTFATTDNIGVNPLPVKLLSFHAEKISNDVNRIKWVLQDIPIEGATVDVERSIDGRFFHAVTSIVLDAGKNEYSYIDNFFDGHPLYYRLKIKYSELLFSLSSIVKLETGNPITFWAALAPNEISGTNGWLSIKSPVADQITLIIADMQGQTLSRKQLPIFHGEQRLLIEVSNLRPGNYILKLTSKKHAELEKTLRFSKE